MSNKSNEKLRMAHGSGSGKRSCDPRILENFFFYSLLFMLCAVANAKLENIKDLQTQQSTTVEIQHSISDDIEKEFEFEPQPEYEEEHFYRSVLKRLPYEQINRILRDEQEPIFRHDDIDIRYPHARSLQPTHEVVRRSAEENIQIKNNNQLIARAENLSEFQVEWISPKILSNITNIDLSENRLESIELNKFENLITLNLSNNLLRELPIMKNSSIELLNLNSNRIRNSAQVPQNDHLRSLLLSGNHIENLTALNLSLLNALETLDLSCNQIKNLETTFFPRLMHNLKHLNLAYNQLGSISRETFYNLLSLNTLLLAHNNITLIDYETFLSLPNLQYLDLSHNRLKGESIRALQGIPDLVGLSIAYNPNMGESLQEFVASWSLKEVDASGTGLCQIPAALAQAVRTLKLADNWFKIINCGDLDSYPLLQHLDLSFSHIEDIEDDAMGRLEFLEILFLDHNKLRKVPISLPTSLEHLFLQYNEIMDLQVQTFQGLKNLKTLDLSHNKLLYLPALPLPKLLILNLQSSGLQGLNQAIVHSLPHLRDLLLDENPIKCSDLLGIAEWASPCRIAERVNSKAIDIEQIGNADVGQQQQQSQQQQQIQTVAKIDLKQNFVRTHNFYEKFNSNGGICSIDVSKQIAATITTPPICAIELDHNFEETKMATTMLYVTETTTIKTTPPSNADVAYVDVEEKSKKFPLLQHVAKTKKLINAHAKEDRKIYEQHSLEKINAEKQQQDALLNTQIENSTAMNVIATQATILINFNHTSNLSSQMPTNDEIQNENVELTTTTTTIPQIVTKETKNSNVVTIMPETTFSAINSKQKDITTTKTTTATSMLPLPTKLISSTFELNHSSKITIASTENLLPQTMPATMPKAMTTTTTTTTVSNYDAIQYSSSSRSIRGSLLERQRRVEVEPATMTTTEMPAIADKTLATTFITKIYDDKGKEHDGKKFGTFENTKFSKNIKTTAPTTTTAAAHKHVPLQLNVKDRHLIGTPLLTHHGQNLLSASDDIQITTNASTLTKLSTTTTPPPPQTSTKSSSTPQQLNELKTQNNVDNQQHQQQMTTWKPLEKIAKKLFDDKSNKKKPSLIMKKMTYTTKHASSTIASNTLKEEKPTTQHQYHNQQQAQQHHQHHHYTLNTPRENEVTAMAKSIHQTEPMLNAHHQTYMENPIKNQLHYANSKHSTVNTPITNGHEHELQTFQEHNELEEEAAAHAHPHAHAHASTSAIVEKIAKTGSTTTSTSAKWFDLRKTTANATHPGIVILLSFSLFVVLLIGLLHVYRCDIPWPLRRQQHQQRPHRMHQQQQQQLQKQFHLNDDDGHSFLSYQSSNCNNQFNKPLRKWHLQTTQTQSPKTIASNQQQNQNNTQQQQQQQQQNQSPFHNLQVRELQPTSAIENIPKYAKETYKLSSALGERSNSQTSSTCSPHSSNIFDDETFYVEMTTTDMGHIAMNSNENAMEHSDLLPMELLNVSRGAFKKNDELDCSSRQAFSSNAFQTSSLDEDAITLQSSSKQTPKSRKLGIW